MNPRASDRVRGFQDTIIVAGDVRCMSVILGAMSGAEVVITIGFQYILSFEYTNLVLW